jgi:outer membrane protein assembly factor BamA
MSLRYLLEEARLGDLGDTNVYEYAEEPYTFPRGEDNIKSELTLTLRHNATDNPFFPTRGNRADLFGSIAGGPLGFDVNLYQLGFKSYHYMNPWGEHVLSFKTRFEVVEEYGDTEEAPISELLFIGGGRTLRGFEFRDVGPKAVRKGVDSNGNAYDDHRPIGGRSLAMASVSYTIPLVSRLRFATFYDVGNVWREAYTFEADSLASSVGVGLRLDFPGFPIRIDRAWVLEKDDPITETDTWVFWIGYE